MSLILAVLLLILGFILLTKGADYFIENSASFAESLISHDATKFVAPPML